MRIVSTTEMKELERIAKEEYFFEEKLIIENVGIQGANVINSILSSNSINQEILFLIGKGNNGSDALAIARHLTNKGHKCRGFLLFAESEYKQESLDQIQRAKSFGVAINYIDDVGQVSAYFDQMGATMVVDGLFGTGVQLPLSNFIYEVIDYINDNALYLVAVDIASGIEGDTGDMQGNAVRADMTLAVGFPKQGHYTGAGARYSGKISTLDVGLPKKFHMSGDKFLLRPQHVIDLANPRDQFADKKVFGHGLILGGSHGLTGAASLASQACLKVGSGLVTAATWEPQYKELVSRLIPEVMYGYVPLDVNKWDRLIKDLNKYSSIVIGPGLARSSRSRRLVLEVLNNFDGPVVIDADAINVLHFKEDKEVFTIRNAPTVLTPHFGEFAKFTGIDYEDISKNPLSHLQDLVESINCTVVLKGPCTYLGCSDGNVFFNYYPNNGMASGGVGDVLAGILGGLLGQETSLKEKTSLTHRYDDFNRIVAESVYIHSLAGKFAAEKYGVRSMSAKSIIDCLPEAFNSLDKDIDRIFKEL